MVNANNKEWTDYIGGKPSTKDRKIVLQMPTTLLDTVTLSTTNEDISLPVLAVTGSIDISTNDGNITFESLDVGNTLTLTVKNGDISGMIGGRYEDFVIQSEVKKGDSSLPKHKDIVLQPLPRHFLSPPWKIHLPYLSQEIHPQYYLLFHRHIRSIQSEMPYSAKCFFSLMP